MNTPLPDALKAAHQASRRFVNRLPEWDYREVKAISNAVVATMIANNHGVTENAISRKVENTFLKTLSKAKTRNRLAPTKSLTGREVLSRDVIRSSGSLNPTAALPSGSPIPNGCILDIQRVCMSAYFQCCPTSAEHAVYMDSAKRNRERIAKDRVIELRNSELRQLRRAA